MSRLTRRGAVSASGAYTPGAVAFVQEVATDGTAGSSGAPVATLSGITTTVGHHLILRYFGNPTFTSVADSKGNTWQVDTAQTASQNLALASCKLTTALVPGDTITATLGAASSFHGFVVEEWSGLHATSWFGAASTINSVTATGRTLNPVTAINGALVVGLWASNGSGADASWTPGAGFTSFHTPVYTTKGTYCIEGETQIASAAGSVTPTATGISQRTLGIAAYYKAAPA